MCGIYYEKQDRTDVTTEGNAPILAQVRFTEPILRVYPILFLPYLFHQHCRQIL